MLEGPVYHLVDGAFSKPDLAFVAGFLWVLGEVASS